MVSKRRLADRADGWALRAPNYYKNSVRISVDRAIESTSFLSPKTTILNTLLRAQHPCKFSNKPCLSEVAAAHEGKPVLQATVVGNFERTKQKS
jgi:hypothetical protein